MNNRRMENYIGRSSRIIAKSDDFYIVTNDPNTTINNLSEKAVLVDKSGRQITDELAIGTFLKEDVSWEIENEYIFDVFREENIDISAAVIGFAVGDAYGVPFEFLDRNEVRRSNNGEMLGNDTFKKINSRWGRIIPSGAWSDDTSMMISSMDSIIKNNGNIDYYDIMNRFINWLTKGQYASIDKSFGLGNTIAKSLNHYLRGISPLECGGKDIRDNGNGALMRILPFSLYCIEKKLNEEETVNILSQASSLTHAHDISKMSCFIYTEFLKNIIETKNPILSLENIQKIDYTKYFDKDTIIAHKQLLKGNFKFIEDDKISSTGYVVDTLETVIYSIITTDNFEDSIMTAVNMGYDTDTYAAITGSIAGLLYGKNSIPEKWTVVLRKKDYLENLSKDFSDVLGNQKKMIKKQ